MFSKFLYLLTEITFNIVLLFRRAHPYTHSRLNLTVPIMAGFQDQFASNRMMDSDLRERFFQAPETFYTRSEASRSEAS